MEAMGRPAPPQLSASPLGLPLLQGSALAAQQQQRCFAEAAVATETNIWDQLGELVTTDEGKRELAALRSTFSEINQKLAGMAKVGSIARARGAQPGSGSSDVGGRPPDRPFN